MYNTIVTLKKGEGRTIKSGGAWIFDNEIDTIMGSFVNGDTVLVHDFDELVPEQLGAGGETGSRGESVETADFNQVVYIAHLGHSFRILWVAIATVIL